MARQIVLGSQSPRRRELLQSVVSPDRIKVVSPNNESEAGFDDCSQQTQIEERLWEIVSAKLEDVRSQFVSTSQPGQDMGIICADTVVVAASENDSLIVLGKPPSQNWQPTVRDWFEQYYQEQQHEVWTCFAIDDLTCSEFRIVKTKVAFAKIDNWWIDWYLTTQEPVGKAGGYGIQGHAAAFVSSLAGSLTNVIGLPVLELTNALRRLKWVDG